VFRVQGVWSAGCLGCSECLEYRVFRVQGVWSVGYLECRVSRV
jgi:hypothetical protein